MLYILQKILKYFLERMSFFKKKMKQISWKLVCLPVVEGKEEEEEEEEEKIILLS